MLLAGLKRHCNVSNSQKVGPNGEKSKVPLDQHHAKAVEFQLQRKESTSLSKQLPTLGAETLCGKAPSPEQVALAYEVAVGMQGQVHYQRRMESERDRGGHFPLVRTSRTVGTQITLAAAEVLFERDRQLFRQKRIQEMSWAQDAGEGVMFVKVKLLLNKSWQSQVRLLRAMPQDNFKGMELVDGMEYCRRRFATPIGASAPELDIIDNMMQTCKNLCADGEPAEQLALRLSSVRGVWPLADFFSRCKLHACEGVVDRTIRQSAKATLVLKLFVNGRANGDARHAEGQGFCRFVTNSQRMRSRLQCKAAQDLHSAADSYHRAAIGAGYQVTNMSFSCTRILSVAAPLQRFLLSLVTNIEILLEEESDPQGQRSWASEILDFLTYDNI